MDEKNNYLIKMKTLWQNSSATEASEIVCMWSKVNYTGLHSSNVGCVNGNVSMVSDLPSMDMVSDLPNMDMVSDLPSMDMISDFQAWI